MPRVTETDILTKDTEPMAQPVIDTLQVADALQRSGMERDQAEGVARSLGAELGEHVAGHKDLELGFAGIRAHFDDRFAQVDQQFAQVDKQFAQVDKQFTELGGEIKALHSKFNVLGVGVASMLAFLGVIASLDRFM